MKREYNMTGATRATEVEHLNRLRSGKTRITIMLDNDMFEAFQARAEECKGWVIRRLLIWRCGNI